MPDWTKPMLQTFEHYLVDPYTWKDYKRIDTVISQTIDRDLTAETLGSSTIETTSLMNDEYIRCYLVSIQNGVEERTCLGTHLIQTPSSSFDGKVRTTSATAYTPLIELKENYPPIGYALLKGTPIMDAAYHICNDNMRAPVTAVSSAKTIPTDFIAKTDEKWLSFLTDLVKNADHRLDLDAYGNVIFAPIQEDASLRPRWVFADDNSSILYPDVDLEKDYFNVPNVVEVIYSNGPQMLYAIAENNNASSPVSIQSRGRRITYRETNPSLSGIPTQEILEAYAKSVLKNMSKITVTVDYKHGYCPVRVGDCVYLDYRSANLRNVKAKVIRQSIECVPGCPVTETAIFTKDLLEV